MKELSGVYYFSSGSVGLEIFRELIKRGLEIDKVITIPDRPKGRGRKLKPPEIKIEAEKLGIEVLQAERPEEIDFRERPQFIVVADYGKILRKKTLQLPKIAPLNIHPSLLPMYRGAAPIERAMMDGYPLGVSIIIMNERIDAGEIILQEKIEYSIEETKGDVIPRIASKGAELLIKSMELLSKGEANPRPQEGPSSYARKIKKDELWVNFRENHIKVVRKINALSPTPTARTMLGDLYLKLYRAKPSSMELKPGEIWMDKKQLVIGAEGGSVELLEVQPSGRRKLSAEEFIKGYARKLRANT